MAHVYGHDYAETLDGLDGVTNGTDMIFGYGGNDWIYGFGGNDEIKGGGGADTINGGDGIDTANYSDSGAGVTVSLFGGSGSGGTAQGDTLISIENLTGSAYEDLLIGNDANNVLTGLESADTLKGGGGADTLYGDSGMDRLKGGGGADTLNGGSGVDTADYYGSSAAVAISLYADYADGGDATGDELNSIENLTGSSHGDILWGNDSTNVIRGMVGEDSLKGYGGSDVLFGGDDNDSLLGMDGTDTLYGENGADTLNGGAGADALVGGAGADTFAWNFTSDTGLTVPTTDLIMDFNFAQGDRIDLSAIDSDVYAADNQAFSFIGTAGFSGAAGEINYIHSGGETIIQLQTGTSVDIEALIRISGIHTPDASWFTL